MALQRSTPFGNKRHELVRQLMDACRSLTRAAGLSEDERRQARTEVDEAKVALGERGDVWWKDGSPDYNRRMVTGTPYQDWFRSLLEARP